MYEEIYSVFHRIAGVPESEFKKFEKISHQISLEKNSFWIRSGEKENKIGIILTGLMRLYYIGKNTEEYTKDFCAPGDFVAAYSSLLLNTPTLLYIQALKDCTILVTDYKEWKILSSSHSCWSRLQQAVAEQLFLKKERRERDLLLLNAKERYRLFKEQFATLYPSIPQYYIASYLGISPVSLSRIKKKGN